MTVLDATADRAIAKVSVGRFPLGVAVSPDGTVWVADSRAGGSSVVMVGVPRTPVAIGSFIGTPPDGCPAARLACDDANPYTGDACQPGLGCLQAAIPGVAGVRVGVSALGDLVAAHPPDPVAAEIHPMLATLESAVAATETGGDRAALRVVRRNLKPILAALERVRRRGALGASGRRLLDIARQAGRELVGIARTGGR